MPDTTIDVNTLQEAIEQHFQCARCGHCCKGDGLVRLGLPEVERITHALGISRKEFEKSWGLPFGRGQWVLRDRFVERAWPSGRREQWCIFLELGADGLFGCRLQAAKPDQCRSFPRAWRNADSLETCVGLRALAARLRRETNPEPA